MDQTVTVDVRGSSFVLFGLMASTTGSASMHKALLYAKYYVRFHKLMFVKNLHRLRFARFLYLLNNL